MKLLKRILIVIAVLVAIPFVAALFMKKTFVVQREITVDQPRAEVFDFIKQLKNQENYSKWAMIDPEVKISYRGTDGTVGAVMAWESESQEVGTGEQEITKLVEGERMEVEIRITKPFESTDPAYITTEDVGENQTKVTSVYEGKFNYPTNLLCPFVSDMIGTDMAANLSRLKKVLEK